MPTWLNTLLALIFMNYNRTAPCTMHIARSLLSPSVSGQSNLAVALLIKEWLLASTGYLASAKNYDAPST